MTRLERRTLWISTAAVTITGIGFFWTKYLTTPADPWSVVNHPLEPWFLKLHILASPAFVLAIGLITTRHILPHLKRRESDGRRSGLVMLGTLLPMVAAGYLLQVVSWASWTNPLVIVHLATGCIFLLGFAGHRVRSKRPERPR
jgi:hypothetical protein